MARRHAHLHAERRSKAAPLGFTLLELLGALTLSMIVGAMALASVRLFERQMPAGGAARRIAGAMTAARTLAISKNSMYAVVIDRSTIGAQTADPSPRFWVDQVTTMGSGVISTVAPKVVAPEALGSDVHLGPIVLNGSTVTTSETVKLCFSGSGASDESYVYLMHKADKDVPITTGATKITTVRLYGATGMARVFENRALVP